MSHQYCRVSTVSSINPENSECLLYTSWKKHMLVNTKNLWICDLKTQTMFENYCYWYIVDYHGLLWKMVNVECLRSSSCKENKWLHLVGSYFRKLLSYIKSKLMTLIVCCNFLLLWVSDPSPQLSRNIRTTDDSKFVHCIKSQQFTSIFKMQYMTFRNVNSATNERAGFLTFFFFFNEFVVFNGPSDRWWACP